MMPGGVQGEARSQTAGAPCEERVRRILEQVGAFTLHTFEEIGRFWTLLGQTLYWAVRPPFDVREWVRQMVRVGVDSLPVVGLTAMFTGGVLALQTYTGFARFNAESWVGPVVSLSLTRELAPVLTALMIAGRIASSFAAELGSMRVTEQIDALTVMATQPVQFLVVPRVAAGLLMLPPLVAFADMLGIGGGYFVSVKLLGANPTVYWERTFQFLELNDVLSGLVKAAVFGLILAVTGCQKGFFTTGGAEGVGRSTTTAVVMSSLVILLTDFFLTKILF